MTTKYQSPILHGIMWTAANGAVLSAGKIYTYEAGTTTNKATHKDNAGAAQHANPIVLDADGLVPGGALWLDNDVAYKFVIKTSGDATLETIDNIDPIVNPAVVQSEWVTGPTPAYISATSFSVGGDHTSNLQVGRRLKLVDSSTLYATITVSVYTTVTTVTVVVDGGASLSGSLASFEYALLEATNQSVPAPHLKGTLLSDAAHTIYFPGTYYITPTATRILTLDSSLPITEPVRIINLATDKDVTINASGGSGKVTFRDGAITLYAKQATPTTPAHWSYSLPAATVFETGGSDTHKPMGVIDSQYTTVGNVGAGEDDLMSYTLPANTLDTDGKAIRVTAWGVGNGIDNATIKVHFGGTELTLRSGGTLVYWDTSFVVIRSGATAQRASGAFMYATVLGSPTDFLVRMSPAETLSGAVVVKFTGENTSDASDNAITQQGMIVELLN